MTHPCPWCLGTGRMPLSGVYAATLALLRTQPDPINGAALARLAGCKETAMNNRMVRLEELGLAVGERDGRQRLWRATT